MTDLQYSVLNTSAIDTADLIYVDQNLDLHPEFSSTHPRPETTHPPGTIHVSRPRQQRQRVTTEEIKSLARVIFLKKGRGLTYKDLLKGRYKRADTPEQAQYLLQYHKKKRSLHANSPMTIPQRYFSTTEDVELAASISKKTTHPEVSGAKSPAAYRGEEANQAQRQYEGEQEEEAIKAQNFAHAVELAASKWSGRQWEMHNIRLDLKLPPEAYHHAGLSKIIPQNTNQKAKKIEAIVDGYVVPILIYPNGRVVIWIGRTEKPFPISLNSSERTTSSLTALAAQIRRVLCVYLSDVHNKIVPPVHLWRLMQADLNTDIRTTVRNYLGMVDVQLERAEDVLLGIYKKMLEERDQDHHLYIRVEGRAYQFRGGAPLNDLVGSTVIFATERIQKELGKAAEVFTAR